MAIVRIGSSFASQTWDISSSSRSLAFGGSLTPGSLLGTIFFWPKVSQDVDVVLYYLAGVDVPATLDDVLLGPPGYQEAYMYQLAERLLTPFAVGDEGVIQRVMKNSAESFARMKRPNTQPGLMGTDAALIPSLGGAYNVLADTYTGASNR